MGPPSTPVQPPNGGGTSDNGISIEVTPVNDNNHNNDDLLSSSNPTTHSPVSPNKYGVKYHVDNVINAVDDTSIDEELLKTHNQSTEARRLSKSKFQNVVKRFQEKYTKEKSAEVEEERKMHRSSADHYLAMQELLKRVRSPSSTPKKTGSSPNYTDASPKRGFTIGSPSSSPYISLLDCNMQSPPKPRAKTVRNVSKFEKMDTTTKWNELQEKKVTRRNHDLRRRAIAAIMQGKDSVAKHALDSMDISLINAQSERDNLKTILHYAVQAGNLELTRYILSKRANPNLCSSDEWGGTPMHDAMELHLDVAIRSSLVSMLLQNKGRADIPRSKDGKTVAHMAIVHEDEVILENIIAYHPSNLNFNVPDLEGRTAVLDAMSLPDKKIFREVVMLNRWAIRPSFKPSKTNDADGPSDSSMQLHQVIIQKLSYSSVVECVEVMDADDLTAKNSEGKTPLMLIEEESELSFKIVNLLLSHDEVVNSIDDQDLAGQTALYIAVQQGNLNMVKTLLSHGANPNIASHTAVQDPHSPSNDKTHQHVISSSTIPQRRYPLHVAVDAILHFGESNIDMITTLLGDGDRPDFCADVNVVDSPGGMTALHYATSSGNHSVMRYMIERAECNVNMQTADTMQTALHIAVENGDREGIEILFTRDDIDCNIMASDGRTPLLVAIKKGMRDITEPLLQGASLESLNPNIPDPDTDKEPLVLAIECNDLELLEALLRRKNLNMRMYNHLMQSPLHIACDREQLEIVHRLLRDGPVYDDVCQLITESDGRGRTPRTIAALRGNVEICQLLIEHDTTIPQTIKKWTLPYSAAWYGQTELLQRLLEDDPSICDLMNTAPMDDARDLTIWTPLHAACFKGQLTAANILLEAGASLFPKSTPDMPSPFFLACAAGHWHMVEFLLPLIDETSDWEAKNASPLHITIANGRYDIALQLISDSKFVNDISPMYEGYTPLHMMASREVKLKIRELKVLHALMNAKGIAVNERDHQGNTPLYRACIGNNISAVDIFLQCPATKDLDNDQLFHNMPISAAIMNDNHTFVEKILNANRGRRKRHAVVLTEEFVKKLMQYCRAVKAKNSARIIYEQFKDEFVISYDENNTVWEGMRPVASSATLFSWVPQMPNAPLLYMNHQVEYVVPQKKDEGEVPERDVEEIREFIAHTLHKIVRDHILQQGQENREFIEMVVSSIMERAIEHVRQLQQRQEDREAIRKFVAGIVDSVIERQEQEDRKAIAEFVVHIIEQVQDQIASEADDIEQANVFIKSFSSKIFENVLEAMSDEGDTTSHKEKSELSEEANRAVQMFASEIIEQISCDDVKVLES